MRELGGVRRWFIAGIAVLLLAATAAFGAAGDVSAAGTTPVAAMGSGSAANTAGASCWGIKQAFPATGDGVYWLQTPAMPIPAQFYCDMTTDGGGWVLVGRGREGWKWFSDGQGSAAEIRNTPSGTGAFKVATLSTATIQALMNGGNIKDQVDGIRVNRAADGAGKTWQDWRLLVRSQLGWSWAFDGGILLSRRTLMPYSGVPKGGTWVGGNTYDSSNNMQSQPAGPLLGHNDGYRTWTYASSAQNNQKGFAYGANVPGNTSSTSYLWSMTNGYAVPFAQVEIRPRIANSSASYTPIPAAGYAATVAPAGLKDQAEVQPWGVAGPFAGGLDPIAEPSNVLVMSVYPMGPNVYVGGRFSSVQHAPGVSPMPPAITQPYLAAFNRTTGQPVTTFRPKLNGAVASITGTPDGKHLIVGGSFSNVNGVTNTTAMAMVDPTTGVPDPKWHASFGSNVETPYVRGMDISCVTPGHPGCVLYATGGFGSVTAGSWNQINVSGAVELDLPTSDPIRTWNPVLIGGQGIFIKVSADGTRTYVTGYFDSVNGDTNMGHIAWLDSTTGQPLKGLAAPAYESDVPIDKTANKQQYTVLDTGGPNLIEGGSNHIFQMYTKSNRTLVRSHLTYVGGDFQASALIDGKVYASCHCWNWDYQDSHGLWLGSYTGVQPMNGLAQYSATDLDFDPTWYPSGLAAGQGNGIWSLAADSDNCLWFGGDMVRRSYSGNTTTDWLGNFGHFCSENTVAPTAPTGLKAAINSAGSVTLSWKASTDDSGVAPTYLIYRNDRVVDVTTALSFNEPAPTSTSTYTVRAYDGRNFSASPAPATVQAGGVIPTTTGTTTTTHPSTTTTTTTQPTTTTTTTLPAAAALYSDSFTGANGAAWSSGWTTAATSAAVNVQSNAGQLALADATGAAAQAQLTGVSPRADSGVAFSYQWNSNAAVSYLQVYLRGSGGWQNPYRPKSGYGIELSSNSGAVAVRKNVAGTMSTIRTIAGGQSVTTARQWIRFRVQGATVEYKHWLDGQTEPAAWTSVDSDGTVTAPGQLFISQVRGGSNVGAKTVTIDDLRLDS